MKKKYLTAGIIITACTLCVAVIYAAIRFFPLLQAAHTLGQIRDAGSIGYDVDITLNRKNFSKEQEQFFQAVSWILEVDEESCMNWKAHGCVSEGKGYAQIFCGALEGAVTDAYFGEDYVVINVKMLYETLRKNFGGAHPILAKLLPDWQYSDYISLEQIEKILDTDIRGMYKLDLPEELTGEDTFQTLLLLWGIKRQKGEDGRLQFQILWNNYQTVFEVGKAGQKPELSIRGDDMGDSRTITSCRADISSGDTEEIIYPDSVMGKDELQQFENLWGMVRELQGNSREER